MIKEDDKYKLHVKDDIYTLSTYYDETISEEKINELRTLVYEEPDIYDVRKQIYSVLRGSTDISLILQKYINKLMYNAKRFDKQLSPNEYIANDDMIRKFFGHLKAKPKFYSSDDLLSNFLLHLRLGGHRIVAKVGNYPIKSVKQILKKYNTNNNYYDYSCGWGSRMMGSLAMGVNYFGTDPNQELTEKLRELYKEFNHFTDTSVDIRTQGSEIFIPEFKGKMGLAFSSPPYFNLEEYSTKIIDTYQEWLDTYWTETVKNIYEYLTPNGYFLLNIKSFEKIDLEKDMSNIVLSNGFEFIKFETLEMSTRQNGYNDENTEKIFVFKKSTAPDIEDWSW